MYSTFVRKQPWIVLNFPEDNAPEVTGEYTWHVIFQCAICGDRTEKDFLVPASDDPVWQTIDPEEGTPESYALRMAYQQEHLHPDKSDNPWSWKLPLLNPSVHVNGIDMEALVERLTKEMAKKS